MGLLRRSAQDDTVEAGNGAPGVDDDVYVVSRKAAGHAARAEKERAKAARAQRKLAELDLADQAAAAADTADTADNAGTGDTAPSTKAAKKAAKKAKKETGPEPVTGTTVKRWIGIARVVVPVVAPLVYQAVGEARSRWDTHRARQLGVAPEELADFSGHGAALYARIHRQALSVRELRGRRTDDREAGAFADDAEHRLADLEAAVRSAEQMPSSRRRSAHTAVAEELDRIETRLLAFWGVDGSTRTPGGLPGSSTNGSTGAR